MNKKQERECTGHFCGSHKCLFDSRDWKDVKEPPEPFTRVLIYDDQEGFATALRDELGFWCLDPLQGCGADCAIFNVTKWKEIN